MLYTLQSAKSAVKTQHALTFDGVLQESRSTHESMSAEEPLSAPNPSRPAARAGNISICMFMYKYMYVCIEYVYVYVCVYAYVHAHVYVYVYDVLQESTHESMSTHTSQCKQLLESMLTNIYIQRESARAHARESTVVQTI